MAFLKCINLTQDLIPHDRHTESLRLKMKRDSLFVRSTIHNDGFNRFINDLGGDFIALTTEAGFDIENVKSKFEYESWNKVCDLYELASKKLNEPYLGIKWAFAMPKDYRVSGPNLFLISLSPNISDFIDKAIEYQKIHTNGVSFSYEDSIDDGTLTGKISLHPKSPPCRQLMEHIVAGIAVMGRGHLPDFKVKHVSFQHSAPEDMTWYEKAFQCDVEFNAHSNTMVVDRQVLGLKPDNIGKKTIAAIVNGYFNWKIKSHTPTPQSMSDLITEILPTVFGVKNSNMNSVATALNIHPKKLQRLLQDEGVRYSDILDNARKDITKRLLIESDIPINQLAAMLDYSAPRTFTAAAKRWFGQNPTAFRQKFRQ